MNLSGIKGAILEELILHLLEKVGYRIILPEEEGTRNGKSGLDVQGRGDWHQIDAFAAFEYTPAFMYPLRLFVEAKCYDDSRPIGIEVVRNAVATLKDISENYFTYRLNESKSDSLKVQRFNYQSAIFSTSGYTKGAQNFAIAHQIFLIQYDGISPFKPISEGLQLLKDYYFKKDVPTRKGSQNQIRQFVRALLNNEEILNNNPFEEEGLQFFRENIARPLQSIEGSYFGMLHGKWPIHLLSEKPLPASLFKGSDSIRCRILDTENNMSWSLEPLDRTDKRFKLEFSLPSTIAEFVTISEKDNDRITNHKQREKSSFITISGQIGGLRRQICLELDEQWIYNHSRHFHQNNT